MSPGHSLTCVLAGSPSVASRLNPQRARDAGSERWAATGRSQRKTQWRSFTRAKGERDPKAVATTMPMHDRYG